MNTMIENYINGNLKTAKQQARRFSLNKISDYLQAEYGYDEHKSIMTASYLKNQITFEQLCA